MPKGKVKMSGPKWQSRIAKCVFVICTYKEHDGRFAAVRFEDVRQTTVDKRCWRQRADGRSSTVSKVEQVVRANRFLDSIRKERGLLAICSFSLA